jgi:hypothetical protein
MSLDTVYSDGKEIEFDRLGVYSQVKENDAKKDEDKKDDDAEYLKIREEIAEEKEAKTGGMRIRKKRKSSSKKRKSSSKKRKSSSKKRKSSSKKRKASSKKR